jgi:hypothetical protein
MNKMLINHLDKIFVTSDTATLLKELEVAHPAAKIMTMAAHMQEAEVGDGSNLVICLIGELLAQAGQKDTRLRDIAFCSLFVLSVPSSSPLFPSRVPTTGLCCCGCIGNFHSALDLSFAHVDYLLPPLVRLSSFTRSSRP